MGDSARLTESGKRREEAFRDLLRVVSAGKEGEEIGELAARILRTIEGGFIRHVDIYNPPPGY